MEAGGQIPCSSKAAGLHPVNRTCSPAAKVVSDVAKPVSVLQRDMEEDQHSPCTEREENVYDENQWEGGWPTLCLLIASPSGNTLLQYKGSLLYGLGFLLCSLNNPNILLVRSWGKMF